jgi:GNAT superfamily N-acetyltransferase
VPGEGARSCRNALSGKSVPSGFAERAKTPFEERPLSSPRATPFIHLRPGTEADVPLLLTLIRELARYERAPDAVEASEADLRRDGFGEVPLFRTFIAELDGSVVGFALFFLAYSTWRGRPTLYLEDLFVRPSARGQGVGRALMCALARDAVEKGCARFVWQVLDWNTPSLRFYESLGADIVHEWLTCRMEGEALQALAAQAR